MTDYQDSSIARVEEVLKGLTLDLDYYRAVPPLKCTQLMSRNCPLEMVCYVVPVHDAYT